MDAGMVVLFLICISLAVGWWATCGECNAQKALVRCYRNANLDDQREKGKLRAEISRLKRGDFTPEEFQNLCHNRHESPGCTRADFEAGCVQFQEKLFGPAPQPPADPTPFPLTGPVPSVLADVAGEEPCCECGDPYPRTDLVVRGEIYCAKCRAPAE